MTFMNSSIDSKFQFLNVALAEFFPIHEKHGKLFFFFLEYTSRLYFQIFHNSPTSWKILIFEVGLISYFVKL